MARIDSRKGLLIQMAIHDLDAKQLSEEIGASESTISRLLNNKPSSFNENLYIRLCKLFNCTVGDLLIYISDEEEAKEREKEEKRCTNMK